MPENNASKYSVKIPKFKGAGKTYDFSLSLPGMISAVGAGVLALTFFFVMGILIGRGYRPEADVPRLQEIMPGKEHGELAGEPVKPEILKPEELEYPDRLKEAPEKIMDQQEAEPQPAEAAPRPAPQAEPATTETAKPDAGPERPEVFKPAPAMPGEPVFDYVYQVASFRKVEMAEALSAKLAAAGLRTNIESADAKGATWHRVQVLHHGTPASTDGMKAVLEKHAIGKPLLKKKKAAQ